VRTVILLDSFNEPVHKLNLTSLILIQPAILSVVKQNVNGNTWWRKRKKNWRNGLLNQFIETNC